MSKDAQESIVLAGEAKKRFDECVAALMVNGFGSDGPARETTFTRIEKYGREVGRMLARAVEARLAVAHPAHCQTAGWEPQHIGLGGANWIPIWFDDVEYRQAKTVARPASAANKRWNVA